MEKIQPDQNRITDPEHWVELYGDYLFSYALARVRDRQVAEDMVQDTLLAALKSRHGFKGKSKEKTWFTGILKHKIIDFFRKKYRENPMDDPGAMADISDPDFDQNGNWKNKPRKWSQSPEKLMENKEIMTMIHHCMTFLSNRIARAFALREFEGQTTEKICKVLNISSTNCWVMLHRARSSIRRCLEKSGFGT